MKVLVTGGAGFVGGAVVRRLIDRGIPTTILDDLSTEGWVLHPKAEFIEGSVHDWQLLKAQTSKATHVIHCAVRNIMMSTGQPYADLDTNIEGTLNVLQACKERGAPLVYTSSASIYGEATDYPTPETAAPDLRTPYAVSKFAGEGYCNVWHHLYHVPVTILRLSNVYGPFQRPGSQYSGVVTKFVLSALKGEPLLVFGSGTQTRDFVYINDAVDAIVAAALGHSYTGGETLNVGSGAETSIQHLAATVEAIAGSRVPRINAPPRDIDNISRRWVSITKVKQALGWVPNTPLAVGISNTIDWARGLA